MSQTIADGLSHIINAKTNIDNTITAKGGVVSKGLINTPTDIATIPSGGGGGSAQGTVRFLDYDGTLVTSYTPEEFAALEALPDNPTHEGLTAQGWNWSLSDAKEYVASYNELNIGQMYITSDGKTRLYITLPEGRTSPILQLYLNGYSELDIDWGDGSAYSTFTSTSEGYKSERHEYSTSGDYVIAITVVNGGFVLQSSSTSVSSILWNGNDSTSSPDKAYNNAIKKVEIGNGLASIGSYAFTYCYSLSSVTIPDTVTKIGNYTFYNCYSLSSITIPDTVTSIASSAFYSCYSLSSITIPDGVTSIGNSAFTYCYSLSSITIPDGVTSISDSAFNYCYSLTSITIPDSVTSIASSAFQYCNSLSSITIPDSVTSIGSYAFNNCSSLSSITIPDGVTSIGSNTFQSCSSLSSITIPDSVTSIGGGAFQNCQSLSSVTIPDRVTKIGNYTFYNCYSLSSITIPDTVTSIGSYAFNNCSYMLYIKFESTTPPTVSNSSAWSGVSTSTKILVPVASYNAYITGTNYPNPSTFTYLIFGTYTSDTALPEVTPDNEYSLVWYASMADATSQTNPITVGNGNEVYARATAIVTVSRYVDFTTNTTKLIGNPDKHPVYMNINRCNASDDGTINAYYGDASYTEDGSNGQVMVKIPKFYYKVTPDENGGLDGVNIRKCTWEISENPDDGFTLHPAFYDANGNEIDYFLYGAFDAVGQNSGGTYGTSYNTTSDKLSSVAGSSYLPTNSLTRATARTMATNRGTGWYSAGVKQTMAVQMLMAVEYGFNSQTAIGQGVVSASAATYAGQTTGNITSGTQDNKTTPVNWRGIENLWGNIYDWIDGLNFSGKVPYFCNSYTFVDGPSTGYTQISFSIPSSNYITAFGYDSTNDWVLLPSESSSTANPTGPIGDYIASSQSSQWCVTIIGGGNGHDSDAGVFDWCCYFSDAASYEYIGARLMFIPTAA